MYQFEDICVQNMPSLQFAEFCVSSLWNACLSSLIAFRGGVRFLARCLGHEQFGGNCLFVFGWWFLEGLG